MERTIASKYLYAGHVVTLRLDTVDAGDARQATREIIEHSDCIAVVPVDSEGNVLLVQQFRKAVERELLEIPAGGIDAGEGVEEAVRRELQEEIGYLPQKMVRLGGFYSAPGYCTEYLHLYLATGLAPGRLFAEDTESISVVRVPEKEIPTLLVSGKIQDAKSIAGLYMFLEYRRKKRRQA